MLSLGLFSFTVYLWLWLIVRFAFGSRLACGSLRRGLGLGFGRLGLRDELPFGIIVVLAISIVGLHS